MYRIYIIELSKSVFTEHRKFREANPQYSGALECIYVGMTSKTPQERLQEHLAAKRGKKGQRLHSSIVFKYGRYLRPSLYTHIPPLKSRAKAIQLETETARQLRSKGYAVWTG